MPEPQRPLWDDLAGLVNGDVLSPTGEAMGSEGWSPPPGFIECGHDADGEQPAGVALCSV